MKIFQKLKGLQTVLPSLFITLAYYFKSQGRRYIVVSFRILVAMLCLVSVGKKGHAQHLSSNSSDRPTAIASNALKSKFEMLNYLYTISGTKTLGGIHNREPNAMPAAWTNRIFQTTGKYPALWSGDFLFQADNIGNRQSMVDEAVREYGKGAMIQLMWHSCNPALAEPCGFDQDGVLSKMTDAQWNDLLTDGTEINLKWKALVDEICIYLQQLKNKHIEVLWRPYHEMNQKKFWWGGRPGPNGTLKLYRQLHDYMTNTKGLNNLIWVWDVQDFGTLTDDVKTYNPGSAYWDVAALDVYDGSGYTQAKYNTLVAAAGGKPIAIGECSTLPTAAQLTAQPKWTFFMSWSELTFSSNNDLQINNLYHAPDVVTLDKMPGWH